jgi:hypothetical protein
MTNSLYRDSFKIATNYNNADIGNKLARRDNFLAKAPVLVAGVTAPPTLTAHTRWLLGASFNKQTQG